MTSSRSWIALLAIVFVGQSTLAADPVLLSHELVEEGWIQLFDGQTLFGWQPTGDAKWSVEDGAVRSDGTAAGFLMTTTRWANYEFHAEFQGEKQTNSGIFLRTPLKPTNPAGDCYELNIAPLENPFPTAGFVGRQRATIAADKFPAADQWHAFDVVADRGRFVVKLDGETVLDYTDAKPVAIGHIGLQARVEGPIAFRNIRLRPLGLKPLFNGRNLDDWSIERAEKSTFDVTEAGELRLINGPGQIESNDEFANFVLQLDCRIDGDRLNSGVFFRTLRQGRWSGYESQINNVFKDGDPTKPSDFGTGGIYRRQPARRIVAGDHEWFAKTIVADGPHMAVWVNGYPVSDWTDERPPKENAREGRRDGPGVIAIQGHDPTTRLLFRNLSAEELPH